jgi:hypothetical protein
MNSRITVSGNIISELSEKIPSNIIALNELIKNSYDAGAHKVSVILDTTAKTLTISDNGSGMNKEDIDTLFHISDSKKKYGVINEYGRYTQGSKGLGFLSVFKFGGHVEWRTRKDIGLKFSVNYVDLINSSDISQFEIEIVEDDTIKKGTTIIISLNDYNANSLESYFSEERNYKKIINSFDDKNFEIELQINGVVYSSKDTLPLLENSKEHQLYYVTYNYQEQKIKFFYNGCQILSENFPFNSNAYKLNIELVIFQFPPHGKGKVDQLFINPQGDLTPLIYVNDNLFNNFDMFDPNVMKNIKTSLVLNQMIGFIRIISNDPMISFNSDRSQFLQNELTDSIKDFLSSINKKIQEIGSINKKYLMNFDFLTVSELPEECNDNSDNEQFRKYIKSDFQFRPNVNIRRSGNVVFYSLFGKETYLKIKAKNLSTITTNNNNTSNNNNGDKPKTQHPTSNELPKSIPAIINLNCRDVIRIAVPSEQIDLRQYVASVRDSKGNELSKDILEIKVDGVSISGEILSSVTEPCQKNIEYRYLDSETGLVVKTLTLSFYQPEATINAGNKTTKLITLPSRETYTISYNQFVGKLIEQINSLSLNDYRELISCSLRAIFELSIDSISKSTKYSGFFPNKFGFEDKVVKVVEYIKNNKVYIGEIAKSTKIDFHSLNNMLDPQSFRSGISTAHLGAHKSASYISDAEIVHLAKLLGIFVVVTNEMINNSNIK